MLWLFVGGWNELRAGTMTQPPLMKRESEENHTRGTIIFTSEKFVLPWNEQLRNNSKTILALVSSGRCCNELRHR